MARSALNVLAGAMKLVTRDRSISGCFEVHAVRKSKANKGFGSLTSELTRYWYQPRVAKKLRELRFDLENRPVRMSSATICRTVEIARRIED